jgi:hypothetical protein
MKEKKVYFKFGGGSFGHTIDVEIDEQSTEQPT